MATDVVQPSGEAETVESTCALCSARARVEATCVRSGVAQITLVIDYVRAPVGPHAVQQAKAIVRMDREGHLGVGHGSSSEEAIVDALEQCGVHTFGDRP